MKYVNYGENQQRKLENGALSIATELSTYEHVSEG
jgi:hypothetical protein